MQNKSQATFLTADQIFDCEDEATLLEWHEELIDLWDSVRSHLEVRNGLTCTSNDWLVRAADKAAAAKTNLRRVERQLLSCGFPLPIVSLTSADKPMVLERD